MAQVCVSSSMRGIFSDGILYYCRYDKLASVPKQCGFLFFCFFTSVGFAAALAFYHATFILIFFLI